MIIDQTNVIPCPLSPSRNQMEALWCVICEAIDSMIARGIVSKKARRAVLPVLLCLQVRLAKNEASLRALVKEKHERWSAGGKTLKALQDQRAIKSGWHRSLKIPRPVRDKLIAHAVINCGGRESQAWREFMQADELPAEFHEAFTSTPSRKSYVPTSIRRSITPEVNRLKAIHHGPREAQLRGAYHTRSYDEVPAGAWFQSDDLTPPVYFYTATTCGEISLLRGQFLPMVDVRSAKILGFVLILSGQYDSLAIRDLISRVSFTHGLPGEGFYFENGIWRSARILTGSKSALPWEEADRGLRSLGLRIIHAKLPRAKVVENIFGILQNQMERMPGYCGRDERHDKYERLQKRLLSIRAGHDEADKFLLSEEGVVDAFARIVERYNAESQEGRLKGLSPDEAWIHFQSKEPRPRFDHRTAWILAHDVRKIRVTGNGITIRIGKRVFNYKGEATGRHVGEDVIARFNPSFPDILPFQAEGSEEILFAELSPETPAFGAGDIFERNERLIKAHNEQAVRRYRIVANALPDSCFRITLPDRQTVATGHAIDGKMREVTRAREVSRRVNRDAAKINLPIRRDVEIDEEQAAATARLVKMLSPKKP